MEIFDLLDNPTARATGASHVTDIEEASRFVLESTKVYGKRLCGSTTRNSGSSSPTDTAP